MTRLIFRSILFGILSILLFSPPAYASVPLPSEIADDIVEPQRTELSAQKAELLIQRDSIKLRVAIHNAKCTKVAPGSSIVDECRTNQEKLHFDITTYAEEVRTFNSLIPEAPRMLDESELDTEFPEYESEYSIYNEKLNEIRSTDEKLLND